MCVCMYVPIYAPIDQYANRSLYLWLNADESLLQENATKMHTSIFVCTYVGI